MNIEFEETEGKIASLTAFQKQINQQITQCKEEMEKADKDVEEAQDQLTKATEEIERVKNGLVDK